MWVWSLGREDPLEEGMAIHSSILAWRIPMDREAWWVTVNRVAKSRTRLSDFTFTFTISVGRPLELTKERTISCAFNTQTAKQ